MSGRRLGGNVVGLTPAERQLRQRARISRRGAVATTHLMRRASRTAAFSAVPGAVRRAAFGQTTVREIEHKAKSRAKNSCDPICLRVQIVLEFGCSIRWSNKRRSVIELNSDSQRNPSTFKNKGRQHSKTLRSCGPAPAKNCRPSPSAPHLPQSSRVLLNAGLEPAFVSARLSPASNELARCAEFISVSGSRAARSALRSDLRLKRTSGVEAATPQLHAPMNSPDARTRRNERDRVSINLDAIA
jgi:hypothetical protein